MCFCLPVFPGFPRLFQAFPGFPRLSQASSATDTEPLTSHTRTSLSLTCLCAFFGASEGFRQTQQTGLTQTPDRDEAEVKKKQNVLLYNKIVIVPSEATVEAWAPPILFVDGVQKRHFLPLEQTRVSAAPAELTSRCEARASGLWRSMPSGVSSQLLLNRVFHQKSRSAPLFKLERTFKSHRSRAFLRVPSLPARRDSSRPGVSIQARRWRTSPDVWVIS